MFQELSRINLWNKKHFVGKDLRLCSVCLKNAVIFFLSNEKNKFLKKIVNIHVLLLTLLSRLQLFVRRTGEKMSYKFFSVWYTAKKLWMCLPFFFFHFSRYLILLLVAVRFHSGFMYVSLREADTSNSNSKVSTASAPNICKQPWANRSDYSTFLPLWGTTTHLVIRSQRHLQQLFETLYTPRSRAGNMVAASAKRAICLQKRISPKFQTKKIKVTYSLKNLMIFHLIQVRKILTVSWIRTVSCIKVNHM